MSDVFRDEDGPTFGITIKDSAPFQDSFVSIKEELRTHTTSTPVGTVEKNSVRARSRVFLQKQGGSSNSA